MANATAAEYGFLDQSCDDLSVDELSNINSSLLMALLDESRAEDEDDEMFLSMIDSLEPEITNQDSCSETHCADDSSEECRFSQVDEVECCSTSLDRDDDHHPDFEWMDMEISYPCPDYEMTCYFIARFTENMVEVGGLEDYAQAYYGMSMEEDDYIGLWQ